MNDWEKLIIEIIFDYNQILKLEINSEKITNFSENIDLEKQILSKKNTIFEKRKYNKIPYPGSNFKKKWFINNSGVRSCEENEKEAIFDCSNFTQIDEISHINSFDINSEKFEPPSYTNLNSLNDYINFFKNLSDLCLKFPILINIENMKEKKLKDLFNFLYSIFLESQKHSHCIISLDIFHFSNLFKNICYTMKKSGIDFSLIGIDFSNDILKNISSISTLVPEPYEFNERINSIWNNNIDKKKSVDKEKIKKKNDKLGNKNLFEKDSESESEDVDKEETRINNENNNSLEIYKKKNNIESDISRQANSMLIEPIILRDNFLKFDRNPFILEIKKEQKEIKKEVPKPEIPLSPFIFSGKINPKNLTQQEIQYFKNEKNSLNIAIKRMLFSKKMEIEKPKEFSSKIPEEIFTKKISKKEDLNIKALDNYSIILAIKFIKLLIESINNYSKLCFVIAIDCCRTINTYDKIVNLLLAISLSRSFYYLEIPFSIVIFSDYKFQFVIKDFKEDLTIEIIQRIYDCIITDRFFTRIFDVFCFIEEKIQFPDDRKNRIAFIISNGIDINLNFGNQWKNNFKNKIKYCFVFNKGNNELLSKETSEKIVSIWKNFESITNIPVIDFTFEEIFESGLKLYKIEKLMNFYNEMEKEEEKETFKGEDLLNPLYSEYLDCKIEYYKKVEIDINSIL